MNKIKKVIMNKKSKASIYYLIGNLFNKGIVFLTIPIFTRMLSTSEYGIVNTYLSWVPILSLILGLSLTNTIRNAYVDFKEDIENYINSILSLSILSSIICSLIILLVSKYFFVKIDLILVIMCLIQAYMTFIYNTIDVKYMMSMDYVKKTKLLVIPNIIIVLLSIVMIKSIKTDRHLARIGAYVIVMSVVGVYYLFKYLLNRRTKTNKFYWKYGLKLSLPLIFHGLSINILSTSDRSMLTAFVGTSESGIYSLVYSLSMMINVVTISLENVWIPWFTNKMKQRDRKTINKYSEYYIQLVLIIMLIMLVISPEILTIMAPKEYWEGKKLMPPLIFSSFLLFLYTLNVNTEYFYGSTKVMATSTVVAATSNLVLNFIFIPKYGYMAAACTTLISYVISFLMHYKISHKLDDKLFPRILFIKPIIILICFITFFYLTLNTPIVRLGVSFIIFMLYIIANKKNIKKLLIKF